MEFYCIKLNKKTFDVFEGKQHHPDFWTRVRAGKNGVYVAQGRSLGHGLVKALALAINPKLQTQLVEIEA